MSEPHSAAPGGPDQSRSRSQNPSSSMSNPCPTKDRDHTVSDASAPPTHSAAAMPSCPHTISSKGSKVLAQRVVDLALLALFWQVCAGFSVLLAALAEDGFWFLALVWILCQASVVAGIALINAARTIAEDVMGEQE